DVARAFAIADHAVLYSESELAIRYDFTLATRQRMFAVAAESTAAVQPRSGRLTLFKGCTTYLPYSPLTITVMLMALTQHAHDHCSMLLSAPSTPDEPLDCFGAVYSGGPTGHRVVGLGLLLGDAYEAVMDAVQ